LFVGLISLKSGEQKTLSLEYPVPLPDCPTYIETIQVLEASIQPEV
jgi:hypothetical protein